MLSFCLILLLAGSAFSQIKTGTIRGTVSDESGEILPGAAVEIRSDALMGTKTALTNDKGAFRFAALPPGEYELMVTPEGFNPPSESAESRH
jgi:protocatechuate 3,4-dioxygenase beta subunit